MEPEKPSKPLQVLVIIELILSVLASLVVLYSFVSGNTSLPTSSKLPSAFLPSLTPATINATLATSASLYPWWMLVGALGGGLAGVVYAWRNEGNDLSYMLGAALVVIPIGVCSSIILGCFSDLLFNLFPFSAIISAPGSIAEASAAGIALFHMALTD